MSTDNNGLFPARNKSGDVFDDNRFSEDGAIQNIADSAIGTFPHFFQVKLLESSLIWSDSSTFDSYFDLLDGLSGINADLVIGSISVFHTKVKISDG